MRWPAESIWEAVAPRLPGFTVEIVPEIGSTNTELMQRARTGRAEPVLLVAERQTAGRGRLGRAWHSEVASSAIPVNAAPGVPAASDARAELPALTFSLGLPLAPADWSGLSLAVGLAVAEALDPAGDRIGLKWPNDLWVEGRKLAGILIETAPLPEGALADIAGTHDPHETGGTYGTRGLQGTTSLAGPLARYAVIGIGINLAPRPDAGLSTPPASLREWWPQADAGAVIGRLAPALVGAVLDFQRAGFAPLQAAYAHRDVLQGRPLRLSDGTEGHGLGVAADGALRLDTLAGERFVTSAEVSVRPVGAA